MYRQRNRRKIDTPASRIKAAYMALIQDRTPADGANRFAVHNFSIEIAREFWEETGPSIMAAWVLDHPGTRPLAWWIFDAPSSPSFKLPCHPDSWARSPEKVPSLKVQSAYLRKQKLLTAGEV